MLRRHKEENQCQVLTRMSRERFFELLEVGK